MNSSERTNTISSGAEAYGHSIRFIKAGAGLALIDLGLVECWPSGSRAAATLHWRRGCLKLHPLPPSLWDGFEVAAVTLR
jgi:hypothetical protein